MYVTISGRGHPLARARDGGRHTQALTIISLSLFAKPGEESLAAAVSMVAASHSRGQSRHTSRAVRSMLAICCHYRGGSKRLRGIPPTGGGGSGADKGRLTSDAILTVMWVYGWCVGSGRVAEGGCGECGCGVKVWVRVRGSGCFEELAPRLGACAF